MISMSTTYEMACDAPKCQEKAILRKAEIPGWHLTNPEVDSGYPAAATTFADQGWVKIGSTWLCKKHAEAFSKLMA